VNWPQFLFGAYLFAVTFLMCAFTGGGEAYKPTPVLKASHA